VRESRSPLLAFLDADDRWPEDKLALQHGWLESDAGFEAVLGNVTCFPCPRAGAEAARRYRLPQAPTVAWLSGALLVRRDAFERVGPFAEDLAVGYAIDWFDRARAAGLRLAILPETVLERRIHPGSLSHRSPRTDHGYLEMARRALERRRSAASGPRDG
jgi:GT2 family glycosyltransferase